MTAFAKTEKQIKACRLMNSHDHTLLYGGARSGKTVPIIRNIFLRAIKTQSRHLIIRLRFNHAKASLWYDTIPKVLDMSFPGLEIKENKADWFYTVPTQDGKESQIWLGGIDDKDRIEKILGNEYSTIFANEVSQIGYDAIIMLRTRLAENSGLNLRFYYDCNPPGKKHWTYQEFIEKKVPKSQEDSRLRSAYLLMNPRDNLSNLPPDYIKTLESLPKKQRQRFLDGLYLSDVEGALWQQSDIDKGRVSLPRGLVRVGVAIDPAVTNDPTSDETGILVGGLGDNGHVYILEDRTGKYSPNTWASKAIMMYNKHKADRIIGEDNNGGDLVEINIRTVDPNVSYKGVHASRGKHARAEPVEALYERGMVHHVGDGFQELEDEMCTWVPNSGLPSPNRMDALVWLVWWLALGGSGPRIRSF